MNVQGLVTVGTKERKRENWGKKGFSGSKKRRGAGEHFLFGGFFCLKKERQRRKELKSERRGTKRGAVSSV